MNENSRNAIRQVFEHDILLSLSRYYYSSTFLLVRRECKTKLVSCTHGQFEYTAQTHKYIQTAVQCTIFTVRHLALSHTANASAAHAVVSVASSTIPSHRMNVSYVRIRTSDIPHQTKAIAAKKSINVGLRLRSVQFKSRETKGMASSDVSEGGRRF